MYASVCILGIYPTTEHDTHNRGKGREEEGLRLTARLIFTFPVIFYVQNERVHLISRSAHSSGLSANIANRANSGTKALVSTASAGLLLLSRHTSHPSAHQRGLLERFTNLACGRTDKPLFCTQPSRTIAAVLPVVPAISLPLLL